MTIDSTIRTILADYAKLGSSVDRLGDSDDLYRAGLTSHSTITLMLALEAEFDVEFPHEMMRKSTFESISAIRRALLDLGAGQLGAGQGTSS